MTLANVYVQNYGQLKDFFKTIQQGQAPGQFTQQLLKDLGFASSNHRAFIPLLKAIGFLSPDGIPTSRYHEYRNGAISRKIMGEALQDAYSDLFVIKANPTEKDRKLIEGKFKSTHNVSDRLAELMTKTFFSLLALADIQVKSQVKPAETKPAAEDQLPENGESSKPSAMQKTIPGLHYNIQIHLPATKDIEVFNAIFKSLKEHLLE